MKKAIVRVSVLLLISVLALVCTSQTHAKTYSFKLMDPMLVPQPDVIGGGRVTWWTQYGFDRGIMNHGGKMVISRNADGTGDARVGDTYQVWANNPLHGSYIFTYNAHRPNCFFEDPPAMPPQDISGYFPVLNDPYDVTVRILDWCGKEKQTDSLYLVNITNEPNYTPTPQVTVSPTQAPTATPTPTSAPTPTRTPVAPFLDLPWNYRSKGFSFSDAALKIESFFDHEYPVLSANLREPAGTDRTIVKFDGTKSDDAYSSHDGYDFARRAEANLGEPVLAAAAGTARYVGSCGACGNMIVIDHGNGFQTRYMHLMRDGLIVSKDNTTVKVKDRQTIGKIGFTGNVLPPGDLGAHIHFMVVEDKNRDGQFDDNIPDGVTDPFGWQPKAQDPWESFRFSFNGRSLTGNKSTYLWKHEIDSMKKTVQNGSTATVIIPHLTVSLPGGAYNDTYFVQANPTPYVNSNASLMSFGNAFLLSAYNESNTAITKFKKAFTLTIDFDKSDISAIKSGTLSIYSSQDGNTWKKEKTTVDLNRGKATANVDHMTYFAVLGERRDTIAPVTTVSLSGKRGLHGRFKKNVVVSLSAHDNRDGCGTGYIAYQIDGREWTIYKRPFKISKKTAHVVRFYAVDNQGNREKMRSISFEIDRTVK